MNSDGLEPLIRPAERKWNEADSPVLKLAILRELARSIHAELSHGLATGSGPQQSLEQLESLLPHLQRASLSRPLRSLMKELDSTTPFEEPPIAAGHLEAIGRDKLIRRDRQWERAILRAGSAAGWSLWNMDAGVELRQVEKWNDSLAHALWPRGVILFVEHLERPESAPALAGQWYGRWWMMVHPDQKEPWQKISRTEPNWLRWKAW